MSDGTITIVGREETGNNRAFLGKVTDWVYEQKEVSVEQIKSQLADFLINMQEILDGLPEKLAEYELESMDVNVEISLSGNVNLVTVGGELGGASGLTLHLKKRKDNVTRVAAT